MSNDPIECVIDALDASEQDRRAELHAQLSGAVSRVEELRDGYLFHYHPGRVAWNTVCEFVDLERRCCRFFTFTARLDGRRGEISLSLTGDHAAKEFLRALVSGQQG